MPFSYEFEMPSVTVDLVVLHARPGEVPKVLLIRRGKDPFRGQLAIPGGFLNPDECSRDAALRELLEETGYRTNAAPELLGVYDEPRRDPRGRVISIAYSTLLPYDVPPPPVEGRDDAAEALWVPVSHAQAGGLAFDHQKILDDAIVRHFPGEYP